MGAGEILAAAAQRNVNIIAYPCGQADVPAIPKIHQIERAQRRGEVFRQPETTLKSYQPKWNTERSKYIRFRPHEKYNIENLKINGFLNM